MWAVIKKWKWILSAVCCFLLLYTIPPDMIERYYSEWIFRKIRYLLDITFGKIPFPSYYLFVGFMVVAALKWTAHFFKEKPGPFLLRLFNLISFAGFLITFFFILWGFNYGRYPLENKLNLEVKPLSSTELFEELDSTVSYLTRIRLKIHKDTTIIPQIVFVNNIESNCANALNVGLTDFDLPLSHVRGRFVIDDMFLFFNVGGQYLPFVGEANVDDAVYHSKKPFYMIHEMAHGNGFTSESDCNFLAYVSCIRSKSLSLQYSGELNYLLYLLEDFKYRDAGAAARFRSSMPAAIRNDLTDIRNYYKKHSFKTAVIGEWFNNGYLKILGIKDGTQSYDKMVLLVHAWKFKNRYN
ncbi:MAG: DUF3810 family protein [Sphingobacteriales bacterium]|nr:DUF3810 family protein [Sphingobacteriales bacterium]